MIEKYKSFNNTYSIYDWFSDLKKYLWSSNQTIKVNENTLKLWSDHFIGYGWYEKIKNHVDNIWEIFKNVNIINVHHRMLDVYDELPHGKSKYTSYCIVSGDYDRYDAESRNKYNKYIPVSKLTDNRKIDIMIDIIIDIIYPTLYIRSERIRNQKDEIYVNEDKHKCENFNIYNYKLKYSEFVVSIKRKYSANRVLEMYKPSILIDIGREYSKGTMNLKKLEENIDETLLDILPTIDYEEVIFDYSRFYRRFHDNMDVESYKLIILLK